MLSTSQEAPPSSLSQQGCHSGQNNPKLCLKISQRYQPASYLPGKPSLFGILSEPRSKNTLLENSPAKKVLNARKKWNKKGVSFWQWGKQSAKCVVMVLVWFGWLVSERLGGSVAAMAADICPCLNPPDRELPGPQLATGASTPPVSSLLIGRAGELWRLSTNHSGAL